MDRYWGVYCPQCDTWQQKVDGALYFYPALDIANAHAHKEINTAHYPTHLWVGQEYGKQKHVSREELPLGSPICPVANVRPDVYGFPSYPEELKT